MGANVKFWLEMIDISDSVSADDKAKIAESLKDSEVSLYLDVSVFRQIGNEERTRITQLSGMVTVIFKLDDKYINTDQNITRTYRIIRVHEGVVESITPVFDAAAKTLSFQTDRFSTYALAYTDVAPEPPAQDATPPVQDTTPPVQAPATGDDNSLWLWIALAFVSGCLLVGVTLSECKRRTLSDR